MAEIKSGGNVVKIDTVVIAKVNSYSEPGSANEVDVTGFEDVVGGMAQKKFATTSVDRQINIAGTAVAGSGARLEAGQSALKAAFLAGTEVVLHIEDKNGYGYDHTSVITAHTEESTGLDSVWTFTATLRINSSSAYP